MGICLSSSSSTTKPAAPPRKQNPSNRWTRVRSSSTTKRNEEDDAMIHEHAKAAVEMLLQQNGGGVGLTFDRSTSLRHVGANSSKRYQPLPRSSSSRARLGTDPLLPVHHLLNQDINHDELETSHIVLVHGGGFGAWCWYKTIALLEECKFRVTAIDLVGSGIDLFDTNSIKSLSQYVAPLTDFLEKLADGDKVILVGHDFGGVCISYAMELFPSKIAKAVFIAASMLKSGQSTLDMFSQKVWLLIRNYFTILS
ncbi:putative methylesterase 11, chloroplastic [Tanacetum coccineum]